MANARILMLRTATTESLQDRAADRVRAHCALITGPRSLAFEFLIDHPLLFCEVGG